MKTPTIPIFMLETNLEQQKLNLKLQQRKLERKQLPWHSSIKNGFEKFCRKTSVQGFSYIVRKENTKTEKYSWAGIILIIIIVTIVLIYLAYTWDKNTPTITVISKPSFPVWNIPFPAVTICHLNLISKRKIEKLLGTLKFLNNSKIPNEIIIDQIRKVLYYTTTKLYEDEYEKLKVLMTYNNLTISKIKQSIAPDCNDMIVYCKWKGETKLCETFFQKVNTSEGICCSFNYFAEAESNFPENIKAQIQELPRKISGSHLKAGLTVLLDSRPDDYIATYLSSYGFRLFIHDSYDYADENAEVRLLNSNQEIFIRIVPEQIKATPIRKLPLEQRNCYFRDEHKLNVFVNYSYTNCLAECRGTVLQRTCGCIPLRYANNGSFPVCDFEDIPCVMKHRKKIFSNFIGLNQTFDSNNTFTSSCGHCLPSCELNIYQVDLGSSQLNVLSSDSNRILFKNRTVNDHFVILHIFYGDLYTNLYLTDLFQDWISTLAALGGIIGLLSNVNLISVIEFSFYMFLKPFCRIVDDDSDESDYEN